MASVPEVPPAAPMSALRPVASALAAVGMLFACRGTAFTASPGVTSPAAAASTALSSARLRGNSADYVDVAEHETAMPGLTAAAAAFVASATAAAAARRSSQARKTGVQKSAEAVCALMTATPAATRSVFVSSHSAPQVREEAERATLVGRKSRTSCWNLYFTQKEPADEKRRNLRNRAYNIFMRNKYKRAMKRVLDWALDFEYGEEDEKMQFGSKDEVLAAVKPLMDKACKTIDLVAVNGVLHPKAAVFRKDRLARNVMRGLVARGFITVTKEEKQFTPAYKLIGYDMPVTQYTREPRPWQLPGWKSPWMLKREFDKWQAKKEAEAK
eukprot:TRINITY_DN1048_c0_g1_i1.p1 TRINITY_DN1048_c0_g1~~TRINITY_DN1048_c0_g1_i1.p1  ORF type:complete len:345 (-),score=93.28 TRINITY_DN1048_c0_g1_i1:130-1113(-)